MSGKRSYVKVKMLTEFIRVSEQRKKLEKREKELRDQIMQCLERDIPVKNASKEAYIIDVNNRSIEAGDFLATFGPERFGAVATVSVTKVDALIKLGVVKEEDVAPIVRTSVSHKLGVKAR